MPLPLVALGVAKVGQKIVVGAAKRAGRVAMKVASKKVLKKAAKNIGKNITKGALKAKRAAKVTKRAAKKGIIKGQKGLIKTAKVSKNVAKMTSKKITKVSRAVAKRYSNYRKVRRLRAEEDKKQEQSLADDFSDTPAGDLMAPTEQMEMFPEGQMDLFPEDAMPVAEGGADATPVSKDAIGILQSIDNNLKRIADSIQDAVGEADQLRQLSEAEAAEKANEKKKNKPEPEKEGFLKKAAKGFGMFGLFMLLLATIQPIIKAFDTLKESITGLWEGYVTPVFTEKIPAAWDATTDWFQGIGDNFMENLEGFKDFGNKIFEGIKDSFNASVLGLKNFGLDMMDKASMMLQNIKKGFGNFIQDLGNHPAFKFIMGEDAAKALADSGTKMSEDATAKIESITADAAERYKKQAIAEAEKQEKDANIEGMKKASTIDTAAADSMPTMNQAISSGAGSEGAALMSSAAAVPSPGAGSSGAALGAASMAASAPREVASPISTADAMMSKTGRTDIVRKGSGIQEDISSVPTVDPILGNIVDKLYFNGVAV